MKKHGSLDDPRPSIEERFWAKVDKDGPSAVSWTGDPLPGNCWLWTGAASSLGYGKFAGPSQGESDAPWNVHRYAYTLLVGPIPDGLTIDHLCRVPACVNPDHLEPVTQIENNRRARLVTGLICGRVATS